MRPTTPTTSMEATRSGRSPKGHTGRRRESTVAGVLALAVTLGLASAAEAANVVIPTGVSGTMTVEFTYTEADFVNAVGTVTRSANGTPTYTERLNTSTARMGKRFYTRQVTGGETIEFYLEANKANLPGFTHARYSSDPSFNTTIDPATPEHVKQPQQTPAQAAKNIWVLRWEDKNTNDPLYDADFNDVVVVVRVNGDKDGDGLWDDWEESGIDMDGNGTVELALNLPPFKADPNKKDIYLELDHMKALDHTHRPLFDPACDPVANIASAACGNTVAARLVQAFANAPNGGINLHVDTGPGTPFDLSNGDPLGGGTELGEIDSILRPQDGPMPGDYNDFFDLKARGFSSAGARRFVFHYGILAHKMHSCAAVDAMGVCTAINAATCATGNAEGESNDFIVTISTACKAENADPAILRAKEIGSVMHELGHNLGLGHGGRPGGVWDDNTYKPNHPSVMNYAYSLMGIGTVINGGTYVGGTFDYSRDALLDLPEDGLIESAGVGPALWNPDIQIIYYEWNGTGGVAKYARGGQGIDWNLSGTVETTAIAPRSLNANANASELLRGSNDWANLVFSFQGGLAMGDGERDVTRPAIAELTDPELPSHALPTTEVCDGFDNDGDGFVDEGFDKDADGLADCFDPCATRAKNSTALPVLTAPPNVTVAAPTSAGTTANLGTATNDSCLLATATVISVNGTTTSIPVTSTTVYAVGTSTVQWKVVDSLGHVVTKNQTVTVVVNASVKINCGDNGAFAPFVTDKFFSGGAGKTRAVTISLAGVTNPAPVDVYKSQRYASPFTYTIPGFTPGTNHLVRLHFAETNPNNNAANRRKFSVAINGTTKISDLDLFATVGLNHAYIKEFTLPPNSSGQYVLSFTASLDSATISGIEIL